jgi:hypothetical protein
MIGSLTLLTMLGVCPPAPALAPASPEPPAREIQPLAPTLREYASGSIEGFTTLTHPSVGLPGDRESARVRAALTYDLWTIAREVPAPALRLLRRVPIVISPAMPPVEGFSGRGMCYHVSPEWLVGAGLDAARAGTVEICNMEDYLVWRAEQPWMTLHELAHALHDMLGYDRADLIKAFESAKEAGLYGAVGHVLEEQGVVRPAYALTNVREYFAELSEAYFGRNDFFPFTRAELEAYDPAGFAVVQRLWNLSDKQYIDEIEDANAPSLPLGGLRAGDLPDQP